MKNRLKYIIVLLILFFSSRSVNGQLNIQFEKLGAEQGLNRSVVTDIISDHYGFIWISTTEGLYRYDGREFVPFKYSPFDSTTISNDNILCLFYDDTDELFIGTSGGGLNVMNIYTYEVKRMFIDPDNEDLLNSYTIRSIDRDIEGFYWIATANGLFRYDQAMDQFMMFPSGEGDQAIHVTDLNTVMVDSKNNVWVSGRNNSGISVINQETGVVTFLGEGPQNGYHLSTGRISDLVEEPHGTIWIATDGGGIMKYDYESGKIDYLNALNRELQKQNATRIETMTKDETGHIWFGTINGGAGLFSSLFPNDYLPIKYDASNPNSISSNWIESIFISEPYTVWIGTNGAGLNKFSRYRFKFQTVQFVGSEPSIQISNTIRSVFEDDDGLLWIGTIGSGLFSFNRKTGAYKSYPITTTNSSKITKVGDVSAILDDGANHLLIGTWEGGVLRFSKRTGLYQPLYTPEYRSDVIPDHRIQKLLRDSDQFLWIGTENGLTRLDPSGSRVVTYKKGSSKGLTISDSRIQNLFMDSKNRLWVGTWNGLNLYDRQTETFKEIRLIDFNQNSTVANPITSIDEDSSGQLWLGTFGNGICKLLMTSSSKSEPESIEWFNTSAGLQSKNILGTIAFTPSSIWMSTSSGLIDFNPNSKSSRLYTFKDGLQGNEFYWGGYLKLSDGHLFFGGTSGFNIFNPKSINLNTSVPNIVITNMTLFNDQLNDKRNYHSLESIDIDYSQNLITLSIAALDFTNPENNQYAYRMVGVHDEWINLGNQNSFSFFNLNPGQYVIELKGSNSDGFWSYEPRTLSLNIIPPTWQTTWFRALVILTGISLLLVFYFQRVRSIERRKFELESLVDERTAQLKSKTSELEAINQIVVTVNSEMNVENLHHAILREMMDIQGIVSGMIWTFDPIRQQFYLRSYLNIVIPTKDFHCSPQKVNAFFDQMISEENSDTIFILSDPKLLYEVIGKDIEIDTDLLLVPIYSEAKLVGFMGFGLDHFEKERFGTIYRIMDGIQPHLQLAIVKTQLLDRLSELNEKKNEFLGIAAHDLRNPLTVITTHLSFLRMQLKTNNFDPQNTLSDLEKVLKVANQMSTLISTFLDISAIESGKLKLDLKPLYLNKLLSETQPYYKRLAMQKEINIHYQVHEELPKTLLDKDRVNEVIDNLMTNAIKYTHPGGNIQVVCKLEDKEIVTEIVDTGQGLSKDDLKEIFKTYKQLSAKPTAGETSTGLGLAIVQKIVNLHGGRVWVESEQGKGSQFSFSIPVTQ